MPGNILGVVLAVALIVLCGGIALYVKKRETFGELSKEVARKTVHIGVSNFAFIYLYVFESDLFPILGLLSFAVINAYVETHSGTRRSWGTVEYPIVISILIGIRFFTGADKALVASSLLSMGYGDGFAAIIGKKFGKIKICPWNSKTLAGSLAVVFFVVISAYFIAGLSFVNSLVVGFIAAFAEAYTPFGLDNITVPVVVYFMEYLLCF